VMGNSERNCQNYPVVPPESKHLMSGQRPDSRLSSQLNTKSNVHAVVLEVIFNNGSIQNKLTVCCFSERVECCM
jgi:hypothetical protein